MLSSIVQPFGTMVIGLDLARRVMRATQGFRSLRPLMRDLAAVAPTARSSTSGRLDLRKRCEKFSRRQYGMGVGRPIDVVGAAHRLVACRGSGVANQCHVVAEFDGELGGGFDARVGPIRMIRVILFCLSRVSRLVLAKPLLPQCSVASRSPARGANSGNHSPPQLSFAKVCCLWPPSW